TRNTQYAIRNTNLLRAASYVSIVSISALFTYNDYFNQFPRQSETYTAYDVDKIDAAQQLLALAPSSHVYLPPLWSQHATFALLTHSAGFKSFDNGEVTVLPAHDGQHGMVYAFPASADPDYITEFARVYGALAQKQITQDALGQPLLVTYRIAADALPDAQHLSSALVFAPQRMLDANFGDQIRLIGYRIAAPQTSEQPYQLTLLWQAMQPITRDYTLFIHLDDGMGTRIAQRDRRPGNGSYPTTLWSPGDLVAETYEVPSKSASGSLKFAVGWYVPHDGAPVPVLDARGSMVDDQVTFSAEGTN
ncbi:MAG: hypothetical protein LC737_01750, partial [Chloroflexi bacterium]|nr:hypothetical protein [Chloroflexota bacterium]